ncbi:hypothetical protein [Pedobacter nutrimenti]|uniref:DUF4138 domain-containing protein n=1 Tax=Pedobacter nutrimenti TaxID=1241337 RepID=A0A318UK74_9SPHI|nr:hypothetical protein [Pedobacter nutrimenti]PYF68438.1 hypothetical protein B0O44_11222 [Pedobacter nutrimenti]
MKTILSLTLVLFWIQTYSQTKKDTIYVNLKQTTYVVCKDSIDWFEVGSKEYAGKIMGNTFFLKPLKMGAGTTSLLIKSGDSHIYKTVVYSDQLSKTLYDLRMDPEVHQVNKTVSPKTPKKVKDPSPQDNEDQADTLKIKRQDKVFYTNALMKFMEIADPYKSIAVSKDRVVLSLGNAKISGNDVYLKYNVSNYSGHRLNLDQIEIIYINQSGHLLGSNTAFDTPIQSIAEKTVKYVDPSQRSVIGFVIPLENLGTKGKIFIRIKETQGKLLVLEVPMSLFQKN